MFGITISIEEYYMRNKFVPDNLISDQRSLSDWHTDLPGEGRDG